MKGFTVGNLRERLDNLLADVPLDEDEQREAIAETGIDAKRLAERLRDRVEEVAKHENS